MDFLKSLFFKKAENENLISERFSLIVTEIIEEIDTINSEISDDQFYEIITRKEINQFEANEIYIFLPIVFAQLWLPNINWHEEYNEILPNKKEVSKKYNQTQSFQKIFEASKKYFENKPSRNTILQIGGRSAEIHAINKLILEGGKVEDVKVTKTTIIR